MVKLTGQFTTPRFDANNNKTHEAFLHAVVFVFTSGTTKITRETDAKGKYSFDLANGEYEVSVYLKGNTEKDRFDMRAGEKFVITATTTADALEKWLQVIGAGGKDELAVYYENLLSQMQKLYEDTKSIRDEIVTGSEGRGKWVRESLISKMIEIGDFGLGAKGSSELLLPETPALIPTQFFSAFRQENLPDIWGIKEAGGWVVNRNARPIAFFFGNRAELRMSYSGATGWTAPHDFYTTANTTVDSNGFIKAASPIIKLFNDRIEHSGFGDNEPIFEKLGVGQYKISNTLGLAQEGWTYEKPRGNDGQPYFRIKIEKTENGCIITVHDEYIDYDDIEIIDENGNKRTVKERVTVLSAARDIKDYERWVDLRFHEELQQEAEMLVEMEAEMEVEHKEE